MPGICTSTFELYDEETYNLRVCPLVFKFSINPIQNSVPELVFWADKKMGDSMSNMSTAFFNHTNVLKSNNLSNKMNEI